MENQTAISQVNKLADLVTKLNDENSENIFFSQSLQSLMIHCDKLIKSRLNNWDTKTIEQKKTIIEKSFELGRPIDERDLVVNHEYFLLWSLNDNDFCLDKMRVVSKSENKIMCCRFRFYAGWNYWRKCDVIEGNSLLRSGILYDDNGLF